MTDVCSSLEGLGALLADQPEAAWNEGTVAAGTSVDETAGSLFALLLGLRVMTRAGLTDSARRTVIDQGEALLG